MPLLAVRCSVWSLLTLLSVLHMMGCSGDDDDDAMAEVDCSSDVPTFAEVSFAACTGCHASDLSGAARNSAPSSVNFDDYEAARASAARAVDAVQRGAMPPAGSGSTLSDAEKQELYRWGLCGTPM